jgi:hypothetical protein
LTPRACQRHRREVPVRVVRHLLAHEGQQPQRVAVKEQRVAIRRRLCDQVSRDDAAAAVLHDDLLAKGRRQALRDEPRDEVAASAGFGCHDAHGLRWILLRVRCARDGENGCEAASCELPNPVHRNEPQ